MARSNDAVAAALQEFADLLAITGGDPYRVQLAPARFKVTSGPNSARGNRRRLGVAGRRRRHAPSSISTHPRRRGRHGPGARVAIADFAATSNLAAARRYGLTPSGTMAHSGIEAFAREDASFAAFAEDIPEYPTFLRASG
jgi:hypothetical protein